MKTKENPDNEKDPRLHQVLGAWKADEPLPPRFQEGVWRRIAAAGPAPETSPVWSAFSAALERWFLRPAVIAGSLAAFLVLGSAAGWAQGREKSASLNEELGLRYVQRVDPYQMPHP